MSDLVYHRQSKQPVYVSSEVKRWLWLLQQADGTGALSDEIADQKLRKSILADHPNIAGHQKAIEKLEKDTIEALKNDSHPDK
jgi:hypothetical protein